MPASPIACTRSSTRRVETPPTQASWITATRAFSDVFLGSRKEGRSCPGAVSGCAAAGRPAATNPLERLNKEVKRRADVVGIFPNEGAIIRLIGAVLLEANDEWQLQHRYMQTEPMAEFIQPTLEAVPNQIATAAA